MSKKKEPFYYFIINDDILKFNVIGPTLISSIWDAKVIEARTPENNNIHGSVINGETNKDLTIKNLTNKGYMLEIGLLVKSPEDKSKEYKGSLPDYAKTADRNKLVKYHCDKCGMGRFLLLNKNFPGIDELHSAEFGFYEATCLKCGDTLSDNYNWYR